MEEVTKYEYLECLQEKIRNITDYIMDHNTLAASYCLGSLSREIHLEMREFEEQAEKEHNDYQKDEEEDEERYHKELGELLLQTIKSHQEGIGNGQENKINCKKCKE